VRVVLLGKRDCLGGFERLATFQATSLAARRNQPAKWTHPLRAQVSVFRFEIRAQSREPVRDEGERPPQSLAKSANIYFHRSTWTNACAEKAYDPGLERFSGKLRVPYLALRFCAGLLTFWKTRRDVKPRFRRFMSNSDQLLSGISASMKGSRKASPPFCVLLSCLS